MKEIKNLLIVLAILFSTANSYANEYPTINILGSKVLAVDLNDWASNEVKITITDQDNEILHKDQLSAGLVKLRKYDLNNLPIGVYNLTIESDTKTATQEVIVGLKTLNLNSDEKTIFFKPTIIVDGNFISLNHLSLGNTVNVVIYGENEKIHSKTFQGKSTIQQRFDISNLPSGIYYITLESLNQTVSKEFKK